MSLPPALKSASHPLARQAALLARTPRNRREAGLFLIEGLRGLEEALAGNARIVWSLVSAPRAERAPFAALIDTLLRSAIPVQPVQDKLLKRLTPSESGAGILAACRLPPQRDDPEPLIAEQGKGLLVVTWGVQDPGNLGTLMRSALAFGARGLIAQEGADPWNPKAVRASAGAIHRLPVTRSRDEALPHRLHRAGHRLLAAQARGGRDPRALDWPERGALLLGAEVLGLPESLGEDTLAVTIPIDPRVESLSVATAGTLLLALAAHQAPADSG